ncbi:hypothetical protein [Polynucleobacter necessarius]|uniref:hypothetical protein n=1 Tax=Polynucleobacter necessarius TaxID=576610 RepID=UPI0039E61607
MLGAGVEGLVLAGTGMGGVHQSWLGPLKQAQIHGVGLVGASRTGAGLTVAIWDGLDSVSAGELNPPKAKIALQLALNAAKNPKANSRSLTWQGFLLE